jgi:hypothetical protein
MDYSSMLKTELIAELEKRGLDSSGLKEELIARLEADDAKSAEAKPASIEKKKVWNPMLFRYEFK